MVQETGLQSEVESYQRFKKWFMIPCCLTLNVIIFTNPSARAGYDTRSIFKWSLSGLNSEYSFSLTSCLTKAEELSLPYYLPIAGGRITGFVPFPRVLVLCEMQSVSSRIWTRVAVSISYVDTHYTTGRSIRYGSRVKWCNPENKVAPSFTPQCSSYWKGSLHITLDFTYFYIYCKNWWPLYRVTQLLSIQ